jgi:pectinesterase
MRTLIRLLLFVFLASRVLAEPSPLPFKPDLTVAIDGSGDFKTIQEAVASIPKSNHERRVIFVKDGVYYEKVRVDASCITLRGQSRAGTRLEFAAPASAPRDSLGTAVLNINSDDFVLENFTVQNTHGVIGVHAFAIYGRGDRTVLEDADVLSQGNDTLSLWRTGNGQFSEDAATHASPNGRYYHARLKVCGSVDFICPRGWCYMTDCEMTEVNPHTDAAMWHDGSRDQEMKFVLRSCRFNGPENFRLARHHHDALFMFLDCSFEKTMRDFAPYRVIYPLNGGTPTAADLKNNKDHDATNIWGERAYYFNCHRDGGDYAWFKDNLASAPGAPTPEQVTAKWTFGGQWDPESKTVPVVKNVSANEKQITVTFGENVTVKGHPRLALRDGKFADYTSGSGSEKLVFTTTAGGTAPEAFDFNGGAIVATEASAALRFASPALRTALP